MKRKKVVHRYWDKKKVRDLLFRNEDLDSLSNAAVANILKNAGLMAPGTSWRDTSLAQIRRDIVRAELRLLRE
jgi:hypothetical protein